MRYLQIQTLTPSASSRIEIEEYVSGIKPTEFDAVDNGERTEASWNPEATFKSSKIRGKPEFPCLVSNTDRYLILDKMVAFRFKELLQDIIEILPIKIVSEKGALISEDYRIINPLGTYDCLDPVASEFAYSKKYPDSVIGVGKYVISKKKADSLPPLFRVKEEPGIFIMTFEFLESLKLSPLPNFLVLELDVVE